MIRCKLCIREQVSTDLLKHIRSGKGEEMIIDFYRLESKLIS